jgi:hypothetical protein
LLVGPRTISCPGCDAFLIQKKVKQDKKIRVKKHKKKKYKQVDDWTSLIPGNIIRVRGGPYWPGKNGNCGMGQKGVFKVVGLDTNGIHAHSVRSKYSGRCYIYMGKEVKSPHGTWLVSHKIYHIL